LQDEHKEQDWAEICPHYRGPHCNEGCAARLREVFKHYDINIPSANAFCPLRGEIEASPAEPPKDRFEVMHQAPSD